MSLNTDGRLLEGIRLSTGNSPLTYPPRTVVSDQSLLDAAGRAEYALIVAGQAAGDTGIDVGSPSLSFGWCRNNGTVVRFDFDAYARRWSPMPGSAPESIGKVSNSPRLVVPVPDRTVPFSEAPYYLYLGHPSRLVTFSWSFVPTSASFGTPAAGTVEVSLETGELNFGPSDLANTTYSGLQLQLARQSFFDRTKSSGSIGSLPPSPTGSYKLLLNPVPGSGQIPRVRIGYRRHLAAIQYATEGSIVAPPAGSFAFSLDTGRVVFASADVAAHLGETVYYDGVLLGSLTLARSTVGPVSSFYPTVCGTSSLLVSPSDRTRYVLYVEPPSGARYFLVPTFFDGPLPADPGAGGALVNESTGDVYVSPSDAAILTGGQVRIVDTYLPVESGVTVQVFRSGVNAGGYEQAPDFVEAYAVSGQVIQDGVQSPMVFLPTVPIVDPFLSFSVQPAPGGGTFVGALADGLDPSQPGLGYVLDLDSKQLKFSSRKTVTSALPAPTPTVKLEDSAVFAAGVRATRNSVPIEAGVDFDFDPNGGLVEFVEPVGENDPANRLGVAGSAALPNFFDSTDPSAFDPSNAGDWLVFQTGPNAGVYRIIGVPTSSRAALSKDLTAAGPESPDLRRGIEVVADRFFKDFRPPFRKMSVQKGATVSGPFGSLTNADFSVIAQSGQVNLSKPALPGDVFRISYVWQQLADDGVTVVPTPLTELAAFKIRQEVAASSPGTGIIRFNSVGRTVDPSRPITLYVDGVTVPPENFVFTAPGTITVPNSLTTEVLVVDYFVNECPGGNQFFTLSKSPVDLDRPQVASGGPSVFNGDVTGDVSVGSAVLSDGRDLFLVSSVSYDSGSDTTSVTFDPPPAADTGIAPLRVSGPVTGTYAVVETNPVDVLPSGSSTLVVRGRPDYRKGSVVTVDGDPFLALSASYDQASDRTSITLAAKAARNYIIPAVTRSIRPVLDPGTDFFTSKPAHTGYPFALFRDGTSPKLLAAGLDFTVAEGGSLKTAATVSSGDILYAFYVARKSQPAGTVLSFNYSHAVAPSQANGLRGQRLAATYDLYSPDTFFYRVETVGSFVPEVVDEIRKGATANTSGPNVASRTALRTKDQGVPSLFFDEQHLGNVDVVVRRLLKFYNDLINPYEHLLSDLDGRVVGGAYGLFRYDDQSHTVSDFASITNDVDDRIKLYDVVGVSSVSPLTFTSVPVYSFMYEANNLSRLFPTVDPFVTAALNGNVTPVLDFGKTLGSLGIGNVTSVGTMTSSRASMKFTASLIAGGGTTFVSASNGDAAGLIPALAAGMKVFVHNPDGSRFNLTPVTVTSVSGSGPYSVFIAGVSYLGQFGGLVQDTSDSSITSNHFYTPGRDLLVNGENGQITNNSFPLPAPFGNIQVPISGNELVDTSVVFANSSTSPRRIPALDGKEFADDGRIQVPPVSRPCETALLAAEADGLTRVGNAQVQPDKVTIVSSTIPAMVGDTVTFLAGPNAGLSRTVLTVASGTSFTVSVAFPLQDAIGSDLYVSSVLGDLRAVVASEVQILSTNAASAAVPPALIGPADSELAAITSVVSAFGQTQASGTGSTGSTPDVLNDPAVDFSSAVPAINSSSLVYVPAGAAAGLYKVSSVAAHSLILDPSAPYPSIPTSVIGIPYTVIAPSSLTSDAGPRLVTELFRKTLAFYASTAAWSASITAAGAAARAADVSARAADVPSFISRIAGILTRDDRLYDSRFLWIQQRTDKKDGTLTRQVLASQRRQEATAKLLADQQRLLMASKLA